MAFDLDDFDSAVEELDRRYLSGEAAAHANTWRVISGSYAAINRHERPATTTDWIDVEHRREIAMGPGDLFAYIGAGTDRNPDIYTYVETVHRLDSHGVVVTYAAQETSQDGFAAEWRGVALLTVEGDLINRSEIFDEADLDAAIARFEELHPPTPRLENTATRVQERVFSYIAAGDWDAVAANNGREVSVDDRRRVVNAGVIHGRDANIESTQATVDVGFTMTMLGTLATRGERLALFYEFACRAVTPRRFKTTSSTSSRSTPTSGSRGCRVRPRRHRRRLRRTRCPIPRRRSGRARAPGRSSRGLRRAQSTRTPCARRTLVSSTTGGAPFAPGDVIEYIRTVGTSTRPRLHIEAVHRLNNPERSSPDGVWDLARGLRRRVARSTS